MPLYELTSDELREVPATKFSAAGVKERADLQRLLRSNIAIVSPDTLIIAEEFGDWEDSRRRIDLLGIDTDANLVVIELKRTEDGGHMDLQALRYAAMVSTMTFENAAEAFSNYLKTDDSNEDASEKMLKFLGWESPDEETFAPDVRIVLVSAEFSKELTTSVLWLNSYGLDIRCVRLSPHSHNGHLLMDVEQVIPLPEAAEYMIKVNTKSREQRVARTSGPDFTKYDVIISGKTIPRLAKRNALFLVVKHLCENGVKPERLAELIPWRTNRLFIALDGQLSDTEFQEGARLLREEEGIRFSPKRWFCEKGQLIYQNGKTYALSNQWGHRWSEAMDNIVGAFPEMHISYARAE